ncbi:unnamed protein product [Staurois parvus]|uniref:Secreted protein n=1 Tax=Staurois parvus TaxID=386267 RepID=A0ABN9H326_9NEOB|nr:unnamed protein product [Staurois parvus]
MDAEPLTSVWTMLIGPVLITCTLPRKKKKKTSLGIHTKLSMCSDSTQYNMSYREIRGGYWKKGRIREDKIKNRIFKQCR